MDFCLLFKDLMVKYNLYFRHKQFTEKYTFLQGNILGMKENQMLRNKMARGRVILLFIIIAQLLACIWIGQRKKGFFCDEIYSYGLANSENYSFLDYNSSKEYGVNSFGWVDADYFKNYVEADDGFSLSAPIKNQINDVHPPFYYILLHAVCSAFSQVLICV